jgi:hypothetical protein
MAKIMIRVAVTRRKASPVAFASSGSTASAAKMTAAIASRTENGERAERSAATPRVETARS